MMTEWDATHLDAVDVDVRKPDVVGDVLPEKDVVRRRRLRDSNRQPRVPPGHAERRLDRDELRRLVNVQHIPVKGQKRWNESVLSIFTVHEKT